MELEVCKKQENDIIQGKIPIPNGSCNYDFDRIRLSLVEHVDMFNSDIREIISKYPGTSLKRPKVDDRKENEKLKKLIKARKLNLIAIEQLKNLASDNDIITCWLCGGIMHKIPLGIPFERVGSKIMLLGDGSKLFNIKYIYGCTEEGCVGATVPELLGLKQENLRKRRELLEAGESFVPNEYGFWHWVNDNKDTKSKEMQDPKVKCDHVWRLEFTNAKVGTDLYMKSKKTCIYCDKEINIK